MAFINLAKKEISFKIVYYGPALGGKTTNLEQIHRAIEAQARGELTIISTHQDRTLFFDFLPLHSEVIRGFISKFQLYTVPGQSIYNETRKLVLRHVDGIVFVADSQWEKMAENAESFRNMQENLVEYGLTLERIPYVLEFNKRDLPNVAPVHYMDFLLNRGPRRVPTFESIAIECRGVFEALNMAARMVLAAFMREERLPSGAIPENLCVEDGKRN
ncbi:MAG TPA: gliding-motility protein MglA [Kiritimatiellae bacterium]|nr:gliding-motility protein MglA [Kiritimatiellia bacterium]